MGGISEIIHPQVAVPSRVCRPGSSYERAAAYPSASAAAGARRRVGSASARGAAARGGTCKNHDLVDDFRLNSAIPEFEYRLVFVPRFFLSANVFNPCRDGMPAELLITIVGIIGIVGAIMAVRAVGIVGIIGIVRVIGVVSTPGPIRPVGVAGIDRVARSVWTIRTGATAVCSLAIQDSGNGRRRLGRNLDVVVNKGELVPLYLWHRHRNLLGGNNAFVHKRNREGVGLPFNKLRELRWHDCLDNWRRHLRLEVQEKLDFIRVLYLDLLHCPVHRHQLVLQECTYRRGSPRLDDNLVRVGTVVRSGDSQLVAALWNVRGRPNAVRSRRAGRDGCASVWIADAHRGACKMRSGFKIVCVVVRHIHRHASRRL